MANTYTEALGEWVKKRKTTRPRQDLAAVAFMAVRKDVKAALDAGYSMKTIWEHMHEIGKITYRYETFLKHVRRYIKEAKKETAAETQEKQQAAKSGQKQETKPKRPPADGFTYDPIPKKEDLI